MISHLIPPVWQRILTNENERKETQTEIDDVAEVAKGKVFWVFSEVIRQRIQKLLTDWFFWKVLGTLYSKSNREFWKQRLDTVSNLHH